jgi:hypothetical protein
VNPFGDFIILTTKKKSNRKEKKKKKPDPRPARPSRGSRWLVGRLRGGSAAKCLRATTRSFRRDPAFHLATTRSFLLLFSSFSSLSCSIVKSLLLQCGLVREGVEFCFAFFSLFMRCQYVIGGQKTPPFYLIRIEVIL